MSLIHSVYSIHIYWTTDLQVTSYCVHTAHFQSKVTVGRILCLPTIDVIVQVACVNQANTARSGVVKRHLVWSCHKLADRLLSTGWGKGDDKSHDILDRHLYRGGAPQLFQKKQRKNTTTTATTQQNKHKQLAPRPASPPSRPSRCSCRASVEHLRENIPACLPLRYTRWSTFGDSPASPWYFQESCDVLMAAYPWSVWTPWSGKFPCPPRMCCCWRWGSSVCVRVPVCVCVQPKH